MSAAEILLEHRHGEKVKRHMRLKSDTDLFVIGSSQKADLRITGENIGGCHVVLRYKHPQWFMCNVYDVNVAASETPITDQTILTIGHHHLRLVRQESSQPLFVNSSAVADAKLSMHQVVVLRKDRVIETRLLRADQTFVLPNGRDRLKLEPPVNGDWKVTEVGNRIVRQRLVPEQASAIAESFELDKDLKKPLLIFLALFLFMYLGTLFMPQTKPTEVSIDKKSLEMIYSAKTILKKQVEAKKLVSAAAKHGGNSAAAQHEESKVQQPDEATAPKVTQKTTQALTSLRQSGLNSLIGKIAKRAAKTGIQIAAEGVSPDVPNSGRAFFSNGTTTVGGGGAAGKQGSFKLGGVSTKGFGGGASNVKAGTALAGGAVGTGDVAMVDEETSVEGGLDREAIAEVIRKNLGQIRYCYERQLSSNRDLYGKIMVKWTIDASGSVVEPRIDTTTMKSAMVEGCVVRRVASWKFPQPKGGTLVKVSYPFLFKAQD
jgi:hypothetical protein